MNEQTVPAKQKNVAAPGKSKSQKPRRRRRGGFFNLLLLIGIIGAVGLFVWAEQQRRDAIGKLQETEQQLEEIRESTQRSGQDVADEVLGKVRSLMDVPADPQPTVATIIDVERLRETSEFYNQAENGDHLIITENRAILFDPDRSIIIDVVPVQLTPPDEGSEGDDAASEGNQPDDQEPAGNPPAGNQGGTGGTGNQTGTAGQGGTGGTGTDDTATP